MFGFYKRISKILCVVVLVVSSSAEAYVGGACVVFEKYSVYVDGKYSSVAAGGGRILNLSPYMSDSGESYLAILMYKAPDGRFARKAIEKAFKGNTLRKIEEADGYEVYFNSSHTYILKPRVGDKYVAAMCIHENNCQLWIDYDDELQIRLTVPRKGKEFSDFYEAAKKINSIVKDGNSCEHS